MAGSRGRVVMFSDQAKKLADQAARLRAEVEALEKTMPAKPVTVQVRCITRRDGRVWGAPPC